MKYVTGLLLGAAAVGCKPYTGGGCVVPDYFAYRQGDEPLLVADLAGRVTDTPPGLVVDISTDDFPSFIGETLSVDGSASAGFTLVDQNASGIAQKPCIWDFSTNFRFTYYLLLPADWDPSLSKTFPPVVIDSMSDGTEEVHTLWFGWTIAVTPDFAGSMP